MKGVKAVCRSTKSYRSAPGGSGAGGSVVIITQSIVGNPNGKILVRGGSPTKCAWGVGGGTSKVPFCTKKGNTYCFTIYHINSYSKWRQDQVVNSNIKIYLSDLVLHSHDHRVL